jgi:hypothetical protein
MNTTLVQVLGAVAYGEWKAYEGAKADAAAAPDEATRRRFRKVAAEELRHHKGFVARLEALGADPERAMRPFRGPLDRYHGHRSDDPVEEAVFSYLGEGVADDLLHWLRRVVDPETAAFIDTVIADEVDHEAAAASDGGAHALERSAGRHAARRLRPAGSPPRAPRRAPRRSRPADGRRRPGPVRGALSDDAQLQVGRTFASQRSNTEASPVRATPDAPRP